MSQASDAPTVGASDRIIRTVTAVAGVSFLVLGILGFIPGIIDYDALALAGRDSTAEIFGLFRVSVLHNLIHLAFGVAGLAMSRTAIASRFFLVGGGIAYWVLWLYGLFAEQHTAANFLPYNHADNWLHFVLGAVMIAVGMSLTYGRGEIRRRYGLR